MSSIVKCGEMTTEIHKYQAEYIWTIKNWKVWLDSSPDYLTTTIFNVETLNADGRPEDYKFQLLAKPHLTPSGKRCIGFKVIPLNPTLPQGSFKFKLVKKSFGKLWTQIKWDPITFGKADTTISCLYSCSSQNLTIKATLSIIVPTDDTALPKYSDLFDWPLVGVCTDGCSGIRFGGLCAGSWFSLKLESVKKEIVDILYRKFEN